MKQFDRWAMVIAVIVFAVIAVYGMRIGNTDIRNFGGTNFTLFSGAFLALLNRELSNGNGNGNKNGSGSENPTH